jgi:pyruvate/2-oxoglutarate dehydrogenase complex dihydrolipoamide acyltransferase (E2) component
MTELVRGLVVRDRIPLNRIGKAMAKGMKASVDNLALSQVSKELDLEALQTLRRAELTETEPRISLNVLLMAAVANMLSEHPYLNAELKDNQVVLFEPVNLGMAVSTSDGLVVTVVQEADKLTISQLAATINDLGERAHSGQLGLSDIEGGTFTVSNLGMFGADSGMPIPRPPESAILLFGAVRPRAVVVEGQLLVHETCWATLTYDHRYVDGVTAARFMQGLSDLLEDPHKLLDLAGYLAEETGS